MSGLGGPVSTLAHREVVRFMRDRGRVIGSLASPLVFWIVLGSGFGNSFEGGYLRYFFPGTLAMIVLFTAIFSTITLIEDRNAGFLQAVLVSPVPRSAIVLGKMAGATLLAVGQSLLFLLLAPLAGFSLTPLTVAASLGAFAAVGLGCTALGFWVAWRMDSTHGFHTIMNLVMLPMWLLSGAAFPLDGASPWIAWVMRLNPFTYGMALLRRALDPGVTGLPPLGASLGVTLAFAVILFGLCLREVRNRSGARA